MLLKNNFFVKVLCSLTILSLIIFSCDQNIEKQVTLDDLKHEYSLKVAADQENFTTSGELNFANASEAKRFIEGVRNSKPLRTVTRGVLSPGSISVRSAKGVSSLGRVSQLDNSETISQPAGIGASYNVSLDWGPGYSNVNANGSITAPLNACSFTQTTTSTNAAQYQSGVIYYNIQGYQNYNIIVEGIGTVYQQPITISGSYNTQTGQSTITVKNR